MTLRVLQQQLEHIYEFTNPYNIESFVITDVELARLLDTSVRARDIPEKLLLQQRGDDLDISLYLDQALVERLRAHNLHEQLRTQHLADFWTVVEGISHFSYLIFNARYKRSITLFEMELQAEVDKYVSAAALFARQNTGRIPEDLHSTLFANPRFDETLDTTEYERYRLANEYAGIYCAALHDHFISNKSNRLATNEIRRFYRLLHSQKITRIEKLSTLH
jgi:hypothetical protein